MLKSRQFNVKINEHERKEEARIIRGVLLLIELITYYETNRRCSDIIMNVLSLTTNSVRTTGRVAYP